MLESKTLTRPVGRDQIGRPFQPGRPRNTGLWHLHPMLTCK